MFSFFLIFFLLLQAILQLIALCEYLCVCVYIPTMAIAGLRSMNIEIFKNRYTKIFPLKCIDLDLLTVFENACFPTHYKKCMYI